MNVEENSKPEKYRGQITELEQTADLMRKNLENVNAELARLKQENLSGWDEEPVPYDFLPDAAEPEKQTRVKRSEVDDMESRIGKSLMGIVASALIFMSLIFFATLIYPTLSNAVKLCTMYILSMAFLVTGLVLLRRDKGSRVYISLAGCGVGALYISLLLTDIYFRYINDITLYVLILVWVIGVCILSRLQSKIFLAIGQVGVFVSMVFGHRLCEAAQNANKYIILTIFYITAFSIFYIAHLDRVYAGNRISNIFFILNAYAYSSFYVQRGEGEVYFYVTAVLVVLFVFAFTVFNLLYIKPYAPEVVSEQNTAPHSGNSMWEFAICNALLFIPLFMFAANVLILFGGSQLMVSILYIVLSLCLIVCIEYRLRSQSIDGLGKGIMIICLLFFLTIGTLTVPGMMEYCHLFAWMLLCMIAGFWLDDMLYKAVGMCMFSWFAVSVSMSYACNLVEGILGFILITSLLHVRKGQYHTFIKCWSYVLLQILLLKDLSLLLTTSSDWRSFVIFVVPSLVNVVAGCSKYTRVAGSDERDVYLENVTGIINAVFMLASLFMMHIVSDSVCHMLVICVSLLLFIINTGKMMNITYRQDGAKRPTHMSAYFGGTGTDIYVGCKFTVWMVVMLKSCNVSNYVVSITCIVLAIVSVIAGFAIKHKVLRLYGLTLSLISVVKLVMIDIYYNNSVGRTLSFFVSGLLCFVISIIYNHIDKKMKKEN